MKLSDILGPGATVVIKNINIINNEKDEDDDPIVNPGIDYGEDKKAKWAPPLQQELSVMKSSIGVTPDADTTEEPEQDLEVKQDDSTKQLELIKKLSDIFGK
jgi:hypothetical protein